eukprot:5252009-Pyramimonas_sp.AAC.1
MRRTPAASHAHSRLPCQPPICAAHVQPRIARVLLETACAHSHWGAAHWRPPPRPFAAPAHPSCG